jgi:hypothetical protein
MHAIDAMTAADILGRLPRRLHEIIDQHVAEKSRPC